MAFRKYRTSVSTLTIRCITLWRVELLQYVSHDHCLGNPIADKKGMTKMKMAQLNWNRIRKFYKTPAHRETHGGVSREGARLGAEALKKRGCSGGH